MFFEADTLDDLLNKVFTELVRRPFNIESSRGKKLGKTSEIFGALIQLNNPRARLSLTETKGKPFSALGELLWYLSRSNDLEFIKYYIKQYNSEAEKNGKIHGGYGPRLFKMHEKFNQVATIIDMLKKSPTTRRAVIQIFDAADNDSRRKQKYKDIPCTCTIQFTIRKKKLNMFTSMRSNDAFLGLPHDIFCFTMLQEMIARSLNVNVGIYSHAAGSLHLYKKHVNRVKEYLAEGFQSKKIEMPAMPKGDPWGSIKVILKEEAFIRTHKSSSGKSKLPPYWEDIIRLLIIHTNVKTGNLKVVSGVRMQMHNKIYHTFIDDKLRVLKNSKRK